jgi:hypothetical protein
MSFSSHEDGMRDMSTEVRTMMLSRKDVAATALTALVVVTFVATHEGWNVWLVGGSHPLGGRSDLASWRSDLRARLTWSRCRDEASRDAWGAGARAGDVGPCDWVTDAPAASGRRHRCALGGLDPTALRSWLEAITFYIGTSNRAGSARRAGSGRFQSPSRKSRPVRPCALIARVASFPDDAQRSGDQSRQCVCAASV